MSQPTLCSAFEEQVKLHPQRVALAVGEMRLTYEQVNVAANALAHTLRHDSDSSPVALFFEKGELAVIAMLGALKSGRPYLPLDPHYPRQRIDYALRQAEVGTLLTSPTCWQQAQGLASPRLEVFDGRGPGTAPDLRLAQDPDSTAYILYTSGSTGQPKGVCQTHRNALHFISTYSRRLGVGCSDRVSCLPSYAFAASVLDIYAALLNGASLHPLEVARLGLEETRRWLADSQISVLHCVPTLFRELFRDARPEHCRSIRALDIAAETMTHLDFQLFRQKFSPGARFFTHLAFTEGSVAAQHLFEHDSAVSEGRLPTGHDSDGMELLVVDEQGAPVAAGEAGELLVRSPFLSPGYVGENQAPFAVCSATGIRTFRTGDLGRRPPGGMLEFLGRKDSRLRIRGYSVYPLEVEAALVTHPAVRAAVVAPFAEGLVAYLIAEEAPVAPGELRRHLLDALPAPVIPGHYLWVRSFPLTPSGKVDRKALPEPQLSTPTVSEVVLSPLEKALQCLWVDVLGVEGIGRDDNFFDLGGDSLLAMRLLSQLEKDFHVSLPSQALLQAPTLAGMAAWIRAALESRPAFPSPLLTLQEGSGLVPTFVIPGGWGAPENVLFFARLARRVGVDFPFYGLHQLDTQGNPGRFGSCQELAGHYAGALHQVLPEGPFLLIGECIGSPLALEVARQLWALGRRDYRLLLLEPPKPGLIFSLRLLLRPWQEEVNFHWQILRGLSGQELLNHLLGLLGRLPRRLGWRTGSPPPPVISGGGVVGLAESTRRCLSNYRRYARLAPLLAFEGPIELWMNRACAATEAWWRCRTRAGLRVESVGGSHADYLHGNAEWVAPKLRGLLQKIGKNGE